MQGRCWIAIGLTTLLIAGCGSSRSSGPVSSSTALRNVINKIDSGPNWETAEDSAAVHAEIVGSVGSSYDGCHQMFSGNGKQKEGYLCTLEYRDLSASNASNGFVVLHFTETNDGSRIRPVTSSPSVTRGIKASPAPAAAVTTSTAASPPATTVAHAQVLSTGGATDQSRCPGSPYTVRSHTSCAFARNVYETVLAFYTHHSYIPATIADHSPVTGLTYGLTCVINAGGSEVDCYTSDGAEVTMSVGPYTAPTSPATTSAAATAPAPAVAYDSPECRALYAQWQTDGEQQDDPAIVEYGQLGCGQAPSPVPGSCPSGEVDVPILGGCVSQADANAECEPGETYQPSQGGCAAVAEKEN